LTSITLGVIGSGTAEDTSVVVVELPTIVPIDGVQPRRFPRVSHLPEQATGDARDATTVHGARRLDLPRGRHLAGLGRPRAIRVHGRDASTDRRRAHSDTPSSSLADVTTSEEALARFDSLDDARKLQILALFKRVEDRD
jgi:hypothetical protein